MIRAFKNNDLDAIMQLWLEGNLQAHAFVPSKYWRSNFVVVKSILPQAEVYVYENENTKQILGFIGLSDCYIAGLFVKASTQSQGIGKQLLNHAKSRKAHLSLSVYQQNTRALQFYKREHFTVQAEHVDTATQQKEYVMEWSQDA